MILFAGGDCAENIQTNLKSELSNVMNMKICSPDTILQLQKSLNSGKEVHLIEFYNQRGASEKIFDEMNNDFGWGKLPFSFLEENAVYMLITEICRNFYLYVLGKISHKVSFVENTFRLKKFIYRFVVVPYKWIKKGGQKTLKLFTDRPYHLVLE